LAVHSALISEEFKLRSTTALFAKKQYP